VARIHRDWLAAYLEYASYTEAPRRMHFWCGVSAVAGALRRKVWIDQFYFKWYANFYVVLVAPPGVVSKSTTAAVAMSLLRQVPGVKFGPDIVTWPALVTSFAAAREAFEWPPGTQTWHTMSAMTLESSEFGNLLNPQDREMVDLYVTLWDGKQGNLKKETKTSGNDAVENPWINLVACTTPAWIAGSFPEYLIGGGFTSRCVFVYADKKAKEIALPAEEIPPGLAAEGLRLVADLEQIAAIAGEYRFTPEAKVWMKEWYHRHNTQPNPALSDDRFGGYLARKQTHISKLSMVLAAARSDALWIEAEHLATADAMVSDLETDMQMVFSRIGRTEEGVHTERLLAFIRQRGEVEWTAAYQHVHKYFPGLRDYENVLAGLIRAKLVSLNQNERGMFLRPVEPAVTGVTPPQPS
jgi:hypothetical protein